MYIREHRLAKKTPNQAQTPVNNQLLPNQLLPNPLIHHPKAEVVTTQHDSTADIQAKINDDAWFNSGRIDGIGDEAITVEIPPGLGQIIFPDGKIVAATHAVVVPIPGKGYRTAYPVIP